MECDASRTVLFQIILEDGLTTYRGRLTAKILTKMTKERESHTSQTVVTRQNR